MALALLLTGATTPRRVAFAQQQRSAADVAQARGLFNQGLALREKGDIAGALEKLRAAYGLAATPITGIELGRTYVLTGTLLEAREAFLAVGRLPVVGQETARSKAARSDAVQLAEQLRGRIPSLSVKISGAPADSVTLTIDGIAMPNEALAAPRLVNPGTHDVLATTARGTSASAKVEIKEGETRQVELSFPVADGAGGPASAAAGGSGSAPANEGAAARDATVTAAGHAGFGPVVYGGFGLAAAGVVVGAVTGLVAISLKSSIDQKCQELRCPSDTFHGDLATARTLGNVATGAFLTAGAGAIAGVLALVLTPKGESAPPASGQVIVPWVGPQGGGVSSTWSF